MSWTLRHITRTLALVVSCLLLSTGPLQAQQSEEFRLSAYEGGTLRGNFRLGSNLLGSGVGAGSFGRVQSSLGKVDGATLFGNPAHLSFLNKPQLGFEFRFPIRNGSFGLGPESFWTDSRIRERTDEWLTNLEYVGETGPAYTRVSRLSAGQPRQLSAFWLNWPVSEHVAIGFGYRQPFLATSSARLSGYGTRLTGKQSSNLGLVQVDVLSELAGTMQADVSLDEITIGTGGLLERYYFGSVWWGISFFRYDAAAHLDLDARGDGHVAVAGSGERFFNDGGDLLSGETSNDLFWRMRADYQDAGFGTRIGFVHRSYTERYGTSVLFTVPPILRMQDPRAFAESWLPAFVTLDGTMDPSDPDNVEILDINRIDLDQPNATRRSRDYLGPEVTLRLPTQVTIGLDARLGKHALVLNGIRYWGSLTAEGQYGRENGVIQSFRYGMEPTWGFRAGLDLERTLDDRFNFLWIPVRILTLDLDGLLFELMGDRVSYDEPRYRFAGGFSWGQAITEGSKDTVKASVRNAITGVTPISFSVGRTYRLRERTHVGVHVAGFPDLLWRFSLAFDVD